MSGLLCLFFALVASPFKSKSRLEAENAALRLQLIVLRRKVQGRVRLTNNDRWLLIHLYRRLAEALPADVKVLIVADRGFGDQKLYRVLIEELKFDYTPFTS